MPFCPHCHEEVVALDDGWDCYNCHSENPDFSDECQVCGLSRDTSDAYASGDVTDFGASF